MAELKFTAKQADMMQDVCNKRNEEYDTYCSQLKYFNEKINYPEDFKSRYGNDSLDKYDLGDPELESIMNDIYRDVLLVSQTSCTRRVRLKPIEDTTLYDKVVKLLLQAKYNVVRNHETTFVVF